METNDHLCILIVDDNPLNRQVMKEFVRTEGYAVEEVKSGKEALQKIESSAYFIIFMDILMPGMDGIETIRRIRRKGVETPIVIVSSISSTQDRRRCIEAGGDEFLPKPISKASVKQIIDKYRTREFPSQRPLDDSGKKSARSDAPSIRYGDYRILLIEEDERCASLFYWFLKNIGFDVIRVADGNQAWDIFRTYPYKFKIIISNIYTSGIDGLGILDRVKRDYADIVVIIYAEEFDSDTLQLAVQLGADGIIPKNRFQESVVDNIETAIFQSDQTGARIRMTSTASQVRKAQEHLIKFGCDESCNIIDIAHFPLTDAGGDIAFCRRFNLAGRCGVILGDVAGHNVLTSYFSAIYLGILTSKWDIHQYPMDLLKAINTELNKSDYAEYHLCVSVLLYDGARDRVILGTAGNPGAVIYRKSLSSDRPYEEIAGGGMCLGLLRHHRLYSHEEVRLNPGDYLFLFSDGISKKHLIEVLESGKIDFDKKNTSGISHEIMDQILKNHRQTDDMVLITIKPQKNLHDENLHYDFLSSYESVDAACDWAYNKIFPDHIPQGHDPCFIILSLREALLNAVIHGNQLDENKYVDLMVYIEPGELRFDVSDEGAGFELPKDIQTIDDIRILQSGGRGLSAMYTIADRLEVYGGTVTLLFYEKMDAGQERSCIL